MATPAYSSLLVDYAAGENSKPADGRRTSRAIGALFLSAFFFYGGGSALVDSVLDPLEDALAADPIGSSAAVLGESDTVRFWAGCCLMLGNSVVVVAIGALLGFGFVFQESRTLAGGYFTGRLAEAVLLACGLAALMLAFHAASSSIQEGQHRHHAGNPVQQQFLPLRRANFYCYSLAMLALPCGSVPLLVAFARDPNKSDQRWFWTFGAVAYAMLGLGTLLVLVDVASKDAGMQCALPGALFEIALGGRLVLRG